jgi:putative sigma-54 modulation protein
MQTSVNFKNIDSSDNLSQYVSHKLDKFDKFLDNPAEASVVLSVEKFRHIAEINIVGDRLNIYGKEETVDMYSAIDMVLDKLEKQIKKNKDKTRERRTGSKARGLKPSTEENILHVDAEERGQVIVEHIDYKPMDVEEAIMQMDLLEDHFFVFTNARSERVNVLYRRNDGDFGLIQPRN